MPNKESNLEKIYNTIKEDIKNHPDFKSSLLGMIEDWKRSQFVILADIISENLAQSLPSTDPRSSVWGQLFPQLLYNGFSKTNIRSKRIMICVLSKR